ncbi:MAG: TSUP family transporter [Desulfobacteraceae bacterium]|nr:TSUP family transporter [Desulfobacteraceae bacterium]
MDPIELTPHLFLLLFGTGFSAGFVDSIAGGGGLIALPVLLSTGISPQMALGTNKLQGSFGTLSATCNYIRKGELKLNETWTGALFTMIGAMTGAWAIQHLDAGFLNRIIPFLLVAVFLYTLFSRNLGTSTTRPKLPRNLFFMIFGLGLGFYDGFFGPGTGSFWTAAFIAVMGFTMTRAAGFTRIMNFVSNIVALTMFIIGDNVLYSVGLCMALGQVLGARMGSSLAIQKGAGFIRPIFLTVVFLTIVRLVYLNYSTQV